MSHVRRGLVALLLAASACQSIVTPLPTSTPARLTLPTGVPVTDAPLQQALIDAADAEYRLLSELYERVAPAVVAITAGSQGNDPTQERGSGFLIDDAGHIVTNAHVVRGASRIEVTLHDGRIVKATLRGADAFSDLAVLHIGEAAEGVAPLALADSDAVRVGERAIAIGNPFGLNSSMTQGIISATGRQLPPLHLLDDGLPPGFSNPAILQVDALINVGSSGGPLLNTRGEVIGVTTAIRSAGNAFQGVGFAIPANTLRRVAPELIQDGRVSYAWLGISTLREEDGFNVAALAEPLGLTANKGVLVDRVSTGSPAQLAGLHGGSQLVTHRRVEVCAGGDIIVAINGHFVNNLDELLAWLVSYGRPGDQVILLVVRGEETLELPLVPGARPRDGDESAPPECLAS